MSPVNDDQKSQNKLDLTGPQKAALALLYLGEEAAMNIFETLSDKEIQSVAEAVKGLSRVASADMTDTLEEFATLLQAPEEFFLGGEGSMRNLLDHALPNSRAKSILSKIIDEPHDDGASLGYLPPKDLYSLIRTEHPQTQAAILTLLGPAKSAQVLEAFSDEERTDILTRVAQMRSIPRSRLEQLNKTLLARTQKLKLESSVPLGGSRALAIMLNRLSEEDGEKIIESLSEKDTELAEAVRKQMFVFEDLTSCDKRGLQSLLRELSRETLANALAKESDELKDLFFSNMSKGAAEALKDDIEDAGHIRPVEIEQAQDEILEISRRLIKEGRLVRFRAGEE